MYKRDAEEKLKQLAQDYPVVAITGPRQSGKTTLVQYVFPDLPYVNLEALDVRQYASQDPRAFLNQYPDGAILDEVQHIPELLSYIQVIVDEADKSGMFILTGSHQLQVHEAITQSLAGRVALFSLLPLCLGELKQAGYNLSLDEALYSGGYPRVFVKNLDPTECYRNYFQTYVERDLRILLNVKDLGQFQLFVQLCAGRVGQLLKYNTLSTDVGVSVHTIKHWLSILEASFIIIRLKPYFENFGKRSVKSPKLYFTDVGFACYLLGIENTKQLARDPLRGNLVENLVFLELMKSRLNQGKDPRLYYFSDVHGHEVDFIFQRASELVPIEVKAAQTFHSDFAKNLKFFKSIAQKRCVKGYVIYSGELKQSGQDFDLVNYKDSASIIKD